MDEKPLLKFGAFAAALTTVTLAVMLAGWEVGAKPMTALRHMFVVNGRTEPDAQLMMGIVKARDPSARFQFQEFG